MRSVIAVAENETFFSYTVQEKTLAYVLHAH